MAFYIGNTVARITAAVLSIGKRVSAAHIFLTMYVIAAIIALRRLSFMLGVRTKRCRVGDRTVDVNAAEESLTSSVIEVANVKVDFNSVGGLEEVKRQLQEHIIWPFTMPQFFNGSSLRSHPKGVLLYGPPGTGKTLLAKALSKELNCSFLNVKIDFITSKYVGETEKNAAAVFTLAEKLSPCVIFVDEIDSLLSLRDITDAAPHTHAKTTFMTYWDGLESNPDSKIIVVGATNRRLLIDDAILRRMPLQIEVPPPTHEARLQILRIALEKDLSDHPQKDALIDYIADKTPNYTGSDLVELCKAALLIPLREHFAHSKTIPDPTKTVPILSRQHIDVALSRIKASARY